MLGAAPLLLNMVQEHSREVRVFAPATVANVACGYDVLGFAIDAPGDEIVARHSAEPGLRIVAISGDGGRFRPMSRRTPQAVRRRRGSIGH